MTGKNIHDKKLTKESEQELLDAYKEARVAEIPDLWETIEQNLAPKETIKVEKPRHVKKRASVKRMALAAAALLVVAALIPTISYFGGNQNKSDSSGGAVSEMAQDNSQAGNESAALERVEAEQNETDGSEPDSSPAEPDPGIEDKSDDSEAAGKQEEALILTLKAEILSVREEEGSFILEVTVVDDQSRTFSSNQQITLYYTGNGFGKEDFTGIKEIKIDRTEKKIKLLEMTP